MNTLIDILREYLVYGLNVMRRRWVLLFLPVLVAAGAAWVAVELAPTKYTTRSLVLLQGANRTAPGFGYAANAQSPVIEQVRAIEAWVKSDEILSELMPRIQVYDKEEGASDELSPGEQFVAMRALRNSLSFELISNAALEISLQGSKSSNLSKKLEIILARIMEGLTGPDRSILSAPQFVTLQQSDEVKATEAALAEAIAKAGHSDIDAVKAQLARVSASTQGSASAPPAEDWSGGSPSGQTDRSELEMAISENPETVRDLVQLYETHRAAVENLNILNGQVGMADSNYVGIFSSPDNLLIIGRPKDPILGESAARKLAIAAILLSIVGGLGLVVLLELMSGVLRTQGDYELTSGLPVVARLSNRSKG